MSSAAIQVWRQTKLTLEMIKFEHSVFALPFALTGALLALRAHPLGVWQTVQKLALIVLAMVAARSAAMAFNRVLDAKIDADNPRTRMRHIPAGLLSASFGRSFIVVCAAIFLATAALLNPLCLMLAPLALAIILCYSYTKRFTAASHLVLGLALGVAPSAAWIAITGSLDPRVIWLTAAVMFWTGGFDILYSCQDYEFDLNTGLYSIPRRFGVAGALIIAKLFHVAMMACLVALAASFSLHWIAAVGIVVVGALLLYEHSLVKPHDLSKINAAFFTVNGYVSVFFFLSCAADLYLLGKGA